jgi:hypothetical protein
MTFHLAIQIQDNIFPNQCSFSIQVKPWFIRDERNELLRVQTNRETLGTAKKIEKQASNPNKR